ncbi:MAG: hypothetical protein WCJ35_02405 [Planctomycetota bacterium]
MEKTAPTSNLDLVIEWLGSKIAKEKEAAISILCRVGQPAVEYLISAAIEPSRPSQHLIAILDVILQIGVPLGFDEMFGLQSLLGHRSPDVRRKVEEIIMSASPCGLPDDPMGAALVRAFNPFLQPPPRRPPRRSQSSDILAAMRGDQDAIQRRARSNAARRRVEEREQGRRS